MGFEPGSEEQWTKERIEDTLSKLKEFLWKNEDICFLGELQVKAERANIITSAELHYLLYDKTNININETKFFKEISKILEFRCAKTREMYPGIAAMALKNKHKWVDKTEVKQDISGGLDLKSLLGDQIKPNTNKDE